MLDSLKAKIQQYGPVTVSTLSAAVVIASYFYGPIAIGGQTIPPADAKMALGMALQAATWIVHHFGKASPSPVAPASLPTAGK